MNKKLDTLLKDIPDEYQEEFIGDWLRWSRWQSFLRIVTIASLSLLGFIAGIVLGVHLSVTWLLK